MLFSDPWPKKRHHKRRLIDAETLAAFARILKDGAEFRWASDDGGYVEWTLEHVAGNEAFALTDRISGDWPSRPADWPETRYEQKARAQGRAPVFLRYVRKPAIIGGHGPILAIRARVVGRNTLKRMPRSAIG